jgi:hypothetical protein
VLQSRIVGQCDGRAMSMGWRLPPTGLTTHHKNGDGMNRRLRGFHGFKNLQPPFSPPLLTEPVWSASPGSAFPSVSSA